MKISIHMPFARITPLLGLCGLGLSFVPMAVFMICSKSQDSASLISRVDVAVQAKEFKGAPRGRVIESSRDTMLDAKFDPFQIVSFLPAPPKPIAQPIILPPPVQVENQPFPYRYFGRMNDVSGKKIIYLSKNNIPTSISQGEMLDNEYRIDAITESEIVVTYLPSNEKTTVTMVSAEQ